MTARTALIIGDNPSLYIQISNLFHQHNCEFRIALDGSLPNDRLISLKPNFVLLDLPLRSAPGLQAIKQIAQILQLIRTRTMVMAPDPLLRRSDLQFADIRLAKPFSVHDAEIAVVQLLNMNQISESAPMRSDTRILY